jgi:hypothetical protein
VADTAGDVTEAALDGDLGEATEVATAGVGEEIGGDLGDALIDAAPITGVIVDVHTGNVPAAIDGITDIVEDNTL